MSHKTANLILIGPPNSGKTTLFNWLTGYKAKIVNYPGSTVDLCFGRTRDKNLSCLVADTPGVYGLFSLSPEGEITKQVLKKSLSKGELKAVILVLDSTRLRRQLPFFFQLKEAGLPVMVALSMYDIQKKESELDLALLSRRLQAPVCPIEGLLGGGTKELLEGVKKEFSHPAKPLDRFFASVWSEQKQNAYLKKARQIADEILVRKQKTQIGAKTKWADSFLLHPVLGFSFLGLILFGFFSSVFWLATPLMDLIDQGVNYGVDTLLRWGGQGWFIDFMANGMLTGFGAFLIFVPQIFILFLGLYLLEDSGYMARAVTLVDGPFSRLGLSGRSLFPFLSGFACAIPATLSARAISSKRERWITIFVLPFMTCSAKLPVYTLLLSFLFYGDSAWKPGLMMSFLYFLSLFLGMAGAGLLNLCLKKSKKSAFFMELPLYRQPIWQNVLSSSWVRTKHFISKAGPVIFIFALLMWVAVNYPHKLSAPKEKGKVSVAGEVTDGLAGEVAGEVAGHLPPHNGSVQGSSAKKRIQQSYAGQFGRWIEPVFEKIGGDWRVGVSLLSAFVAREVFVSVLAVTLKNTQDVRAGPEEDSVDSVGVEGAVGSEAVSAVGSAVTAVVDSMGAVDSGSATFPEKPVGLVYTMKQARRSSGGPLFSLASALALLVFFVFSLQCLSTTAIVYKETGSWVLAVAQLVGFNLLAYILAFVTYQLFS